MKVSQLFDLSGRCAIVTGGGRGIGRFIAIGLAEAGAIVAVASRKIEACEQTVEDITGAGGEAFALRVDLSQPEEIEPLVEGVLKRTGRVDVLVNNAAMVWNAPTLDYPLKGWDRVFALNIRGLWLLSQRISVHMVERAEGGSIIHIGSVSAGRGAREHEQAVIAYNASKGAVNGLTFDMAIKLAPRGIRVNAIAPGPFLTDMLSFIREDPEHLARYQTRIPLGRAGGEDDIKGAVVFLASDASRFVTGHVLVVDGGVSALYPVSPE